MKKNFLLLGLIAYLFPAIAFSQTDDAVVAGKEIAIVQTESRKSKRLYTQGHLYLQRNSLCKSRKVHGAGKTRCMERCSQLNDLWPGLPNGSHNYRE